MTLQLQQLWHELDRLYKLFGFLSAKICELSGWQKAMVFVTGFSCVLVLGYGSSIWPEQKHFKVLAAKKAALSARTKSLIMEINSMPKIHYAECGDYFGTDFTRLVAVKDLLQIANNSHIKLQLLQPDIPRLQAKFWQYPLQIQAITDYVHIVAFCGKLARLNYPLFISSLHIKYVSSGQLEFSMGLVSLQNAKKMAITKDVIQGMQRRELKMSAKISKNFRIKPIIPQDAKSLNEGTIRFGFQRETRRKRSRAAQHTLTYVSSEASLGQSRSLKGEGYKDPFTIDLKQGNYDLAHWRSDALRLLGLIQRGAKTWAILEDPQGKIYQVTYGMRIGMQHERIVRITSSAVIIESGAKITL